LFAPHSAVFCLAKAPIANIRACLHRVGRMMINRAIATQWDKLARSLLDAPHIAAIRR